MRHLFLLALFFLNDVFCQENGHHAYLNVGGAYSFFQDTKFSNATDLGFGVAGSIGYEFSRKKYTLGVHINFLTAKTSPNTFENENTSLNNSNNLTYSYWLNKNWAIGATWDVLNLYGRIQSDLGNNRFYDYQSSNILIHGIYQNSIREDLSFLSGLAIGLASFSREGISFAYSAPQSVLSEGIFDYQDESITSILALKHYDWDPFWQQLYIKTNIGLRYKDRWSLHYNWEIRRFSKTKNYPTTIGYHSLSVGFSFISRPNNKTSNE